MCGQTLIRRVSAPHTAYDLAAVIQVESCAVVDFGINLRKLVHVLRAKHTLDDCFGDYGVLCEFLGRRLRKLLREPHQLELITRGHQP